MAGDKLFDARGHGVKVAHQIAEFIVATLDRSGGAGAQITGSELLRRLAQAQDRRGEIAREQIADEARDQKSYSPLQQNRGMVSAKRCAWPDWKFGGKDVLVPAGAMENEGNAN